MIQRIYQKKKPMLYVIILVSCLLIYGFCCNFDSKHYFKSYRLKPEQVNRSEKYILYWDISRHGPLDKFGIGSEVFKHCLYNNCYFTDDRCFLSSITDFSGIIFQGQSYNSLENGAPQTRKVDQKYIFYSLESAFHSQHEEVEHFYNLTFTFKRNSDVYYPYGTFKKRKHTTNSFSFTENTFKRKRKFAAWFASNCNLPGAKLRLKYVKELSKYIDIDMYGDCATLQCKDQLKCYKMMEDNYLFYLSFENTMCEDYVTEKLYNVLNYNVVPIVLGAANYQELAPPFSVINVRDYPSHKRLAQHLKLLSRSYEQYTKYFMWKKRFYVEPNPKKRVVCELCQNLNTPSIHGSYKNLLEWHYKNCSLLTDSFITYGN